MNKTLTQEQRISIVCYRIESAENTLAEVETHRANGFYNTAVNRLYYACYYAATAILISSISIEATRSNSQPCRNRFIRASLSSRIARV